MPPAEPDDAAKASPTPPASTTPSQDDAPSAHRRRRKTGQRRPLTVVGHINWVDADSPGGQALMRAQGRAQRDVLIAVAERRHASGATDTAPTTSSQERDEPSNQ